MPSFAPRSKVRISLGLKPLVDDSTSGSKDGGADDAPKDKDEIAEDNYRKRREQEAKAKEDEEIRQRIARAQNKRQLKRQLRGPTLGDEEPSTSTSGPSDSKSTIKWLKQAQKKAKEHAERRAKELEELEAAATYGEADLAGLRVAHDIDDFDLQEGDEGRVLTLRDSKILDGDEDELMDASLEQKELDRRNEERKKGPKQYTGIDEEEDMSSMALGKKKSVLSKYDADIPERQRDRAMMGDSDGGFRLGGSTETSAERKERKQRELEEEARRANRSLLNLDYSSESQRRGVQMWIESSLLFTTRSIRREPRGIRLPGARRRRLQEGKGESRSRECFCPGRAKRPAPLSSLSDCSAVPPSHRTGQEEEAPCSD